MYLLQLLAARQVYRARLVYLVQRLVRPVFLVPLLAACLVYRERLVPLVHRPQLRVRLVLPVQLLAAHR